MLAGGVHAAEFPLLSLGQFGLLAAQLPLGADDGHALPRTHADEVGFELGERGEDIEEHLSHRIAGVAERPAEGQLHAPFPKLIGEGAGIRDGPDQGVRVWGRPGCRPGANINEPAVAVHVRIASHNNGYTRRS